jgi:hypothetical protein
MFYFLRRAVGVEQRCGNSFDRPAQRMREYLTAP